ncbi:MAG TPA: AsmA-like C-terminal region-containing protein [Flavobacteriaceae bacterium]|nr:AsmA-like C-terminal region-containing protein [Flavobacteriaceae bacterium]
MKKVLKIIGIVLLVIVIFLLAAPFLFRGSIEKMVHKEINKNLNAEVAWEDLGLNIFGSFPDAQLTLENLSIINNKPFEGDTLFVGEKVALDMGIWQLFSIGDDPLQINEFSVENAVVNIKIDSIGNANYDIFKDQKASETPADSTAGGLVFDLQEYHISNSEVNYLDESSQTFLRVKNLEHSGTGDFSAENSTLETISKALVSFKIEDTEYLSEIPVELTADLKMDFENQKYSFLENEMLVNQLPLTFEGFVKVNETNNEVDLTFKTPSSSFKNFLAVIPEEYSKNIEKVETSGDFIVNGSIRGIVDEQHIPKLNISVKSENAAFKYPDLPKKVKNISIYAQLLNETGLAKDTYLTIDLLTFQIDEDIFTIHGTVKNLMENMLVDMTATGTMNLANLEKAYPLELEQDLNGILKADLHAQFDMVSLENEYYQNIRTSGTASITDFKYKSPEIPNQVNISKANLSFNPSKIELKSLEANSGRTDAKISGNLINLMGFLFADQDLKGNFNLNSNTFDVNDFMVAQTVSENKNASEEKTQPKTGEEAIKIPSFLDVTLNFNADQVFYDNLVLKNMKGKLILKDETATLQNVTSSIFNGGIALNGNVSTKMETPTFQMALDLSKIDISQSFQGLEMLQNLAPIAKALQGSLSTDIELSGNLNKDLTPVLQSITGNALAKILTAEIDPEKMPLLSRLNSKLDFLNLDLMSVHDLETILSFNNGKVEIKPFDFQVKGIDVQVSGAHGFDNNMNYNVVLELPAKYLGSKVGGLLTKLSDQDIEKMEVELPIGLTGTFTNPDIKINMEGAVKNLTQQIIANQKENIKEQAGGVIKDILNNNNPKDSTSVPKDSTSNPTKIKNIAEDILGGLFGKKGKDSTSTKKP